MLSHLDDGAGLVPPARVGAGLVLNTYHVTDDQGWELLGVCSPPFSVAHVTVAQGILPGSQGVAPGWVWFVAPRMDGDEVPDGASEDTHGRREFGVSVGGVAVLEDGTLEIIRVQAAIGRCVRRYEALNRLDTDFGPAVAMGEGDGRYAVVDAPGAQELPCSVGGELRATIGG